MFRRATLTAGSTIILAIGVMAAGLAAPAHSQAACSAGYVDATTSPTSTGAATTPASSTTPTQTGAGPVSLGKTVLLTKRTKTRGCKLGALPDRRCSPGAYYSGLDAATLCSPSFRTSAIRSVPESENHQVEVEYGLPPAASGSTLDVDHIVPIAIGGSNAIANLYPEKATLPDGQPGFHVKDKLGKKPHDLVCSGQMALRAAQLAIAADWETLYRRVFGVTP